MSDTIFAIIFGLLGCFFSALALILMKWAHNRIQENQKPYLDKYWLSGFVILMLGNGFNIEAVNYGNVVLLLCTSSMSIVFNTIFSIVLLGESLTKNRVIGITVICIGSTFFLLNAKNDKS